MEMQRGAGRTGARTPQPSARSRATQVTATRTAILDAAETLFAQHGTSAVTNRQIVELAHQRNNAAVAYHFGGRADLIQAIVHRRQGAIETVRDDAVASISGSTDARDWMDALVRPLAIHLDTLPHPTWYARFSSQLVNDPAHRAIIVREALDAPSLHQVMAGLDRCGPLLSEGVAARRKQMCSHLMILEYAEREQQAAAEPRSSSDWLTFASELTDALTGLWLAPSSSGPQSGGDA